MILTEIRNAFGFPQTVDEEERPSCPSCSAPVAVNRGQGTICDACDGEMQKHFAHDYDTFELGWC